MDFYATLGRACGHPSAMEELFGAGMTGLRLNLSHAALKDSLPFLHQHFFPDRKSVV